MTRDDPECCIGHIRYGDQRIEIASTGQIYASLEGIYKVREGDLVVISFPSGALGSPPRHYYVLLVGHNGMTDLTSPDFRTSDGTFKVTHRNDELHFELGFQNRTKKSAITVDIRATRPKGTLPKKECAAILNMVVTCVRLPECSEGRIFENFAMAGQSYFNRLEEQYSPPETSIMFAPLSARASHTSQSRLAACSAAIRICRMWVKLDCEDQPFDACGMVRRCGSILRNYSDAKIRSRRT